MDKTKLLPVKSDDVFSENRFWEELFFRIGEGGFLRELARHFGVPYSTLHDRIHKDEDKKLKYLEALTSRAMYHASRIEEIAEMVEDGRISPISAKVAIDARKWIASRFHPRQFSEKLMHDAKLGDMESSKLHLLELKKEMERASDDAG